MAQLPSTATSTLMAAPGFQGNGQCQLTSPPSNTSRSAVYHNVICLRLVYKMQLFVQFSLQLLPKPGVDKNKIKKKSDIFPPFCIHNSKTALRSSPKTASVNPACVLGATCQRRGTTKTWPWPT